jgi:hypothetical protein
VSALTVVLDNNASLPSQINAPSPDESPDTSPLPSHGQGFDRMFLSSCIARRVNRALGFDPCYTSTVTEMEQVANVFKGEVISDVKDADNNNLAIATNLPLVSERCGAADIPAVACSSTSENKGAIAKRVPSVPVLDAAVEHQSIERQPMLDISALITLRTMMLARGSRILQSLVSTLMFPNRLHLLQRTIDNLAAPSPIILKPSRKHSNRRRGIYGGLKVVLSGNLYS